MRCSLVDFEEGGYYHVYNHAVEGLDLYREKADYEYYVNKMEKYFNKSMIEICNWCLMSNHFHFLVFQKSEEPVSNVFNSLNLSYVNHYNRKYVRKGKLFRDRLQHKRIIGNFYLLNISLYIHGNPVKDGFVGEASKWEYSDYKKWVNGSNVRLRDEIFKLSKEEYAQMVDEYCEQYGNLLVNNEK
ncbi:MAG: transposase [Candidatus Cloacimonetes bacterium]|nr:transposase [Candidatus Cloacimonadota bacterium]